MRPGVVRAAGPADAAAVAEVCLRAYDAGLPSVRRAHQDDEVRAWVRDVLVPGGDVLVAVLEDDVVGLLALAPGEVEHLHVDPPWQRSGIGAMLLREAKRRSPSGLQLGTFQVDEVAQRFYERHGFVAVERTDGTGNEEQEPDVRYVSGSGAG